MNVGDRLKVYIKASKGMGMSFKPTVLRAESNREFRWIGRLLMPGLIGVVVHYVAWPARIRWMIRN